MNNAVTVDGIKMTVLNALSSGPGCEPHTYVVRGALVYELGGSWFIDDAGSVKRPCQVEVGR